MIAVVGVLMIVYVLVGGMKGTAWVQIQGGAVDKRRRRDDGNGAGPVRFELLGNPRLAQAAISTATTKGVASRDVLAPGPQYGGSLTSKINFISLALALVLGTAACRTC